MSKAILFEWIDHVIQVYSANKELTSEKYTLYLARL